MLATFSLCVVGCEPMPPADVTESVQNARLLLRAIRTPTWRSLKVERILDADNGKALSIEFEGGHIVVADRKTRVPESYSASREGSMVFAPLEFTQHGADPILDAIEKQQGIDLASGRLGSGMGYKIRDLPIIGVPDVSIEGVYLEANRLTVTELSNLFTFKVENSDPKITKEMAVKVALAHINQTEGKATLTSGPQGRLFYIRVSSLNELPVRIRLAREVSILEAPNHRLLVDAENGDIMQEPKIDGQFESRDIADVNGMVHLITCTNEHGDLVVRRLGDHGIGSFGSMLTGSTAVWVGREDFERAKRIIESDPNRSIYEVH